MMVTTDLEMSKFKRGKKTNAQEKPENCCRNLVRTPVKNDITAMIICVGMRREVFTNSSGHYKRFKFINYLFQARYIFMKNISRVCHRKKRDWNDQEVQKCNFSNLV